ncbi:LysR family transcriptional regulator [Achromobacter denitrificans]|uniref:LysR family transcriptional regulator n=1 Tax=Achromobacter denitrificans TaxID=32002 RepID=A0A6J5APG3_ACHDE|nr:MULTISPECIES: LysR substrate-binding domain-containing protein [Achromobacter]ASC65518.1 LysR family transcriptional regulator [Achromobacter denitrificans]MBV2159620.1 LysR family transcriptional regulator [Achromobacter denitrificans]MDF3847308.1 LysR substrate-binding domain-containing protein [Achromobacter denitrificans]MDF3859939.1 LysR substrate-binding domain-containing protein [Achromobacter denitrificans]MDX3876894.1 LysR substrate-binding domain-containing protein [Achromobacter 
MENLLRKLDLTSLRLFVAVCQENSIARAAEREFIAPSAVSRRIAEMEALVGLALIERHTRGVSVTPAGQTVLRHARRIIGDVEAMGAELSRLYAGVKGHVRLVANLSAIVQFLPEDVAAFQRLFPEVDIDLEEQHSPDVLRLVRERAADFGICNRIPGAQGVEQLPYRRDRLAVMLPAGHPKAAARQLSLRDIAGETFVGLRENSALTQLLAAQAAALGATLAVKIRVASLDALCRMTHAGLGVAVMPQQVAELYLQSLDVVVRPLSDEWAQRQLCIVLLDQGQLSATAATLVKFLAQQG